MCEPKSRRCVLNPDPISRRLSLVPPSPSAPVARGAGLEVQGRQTLSTLTITVSSRWWNAREASAGAPEFLRGVSCAVFVVSWRQSMASSTQTHQSDHVRSIACLRTPCHAKDGPIYKANVSRAKRRLCRVPAQDKQSRLLLVVYDRTRISFEGLQAHAGLVGPSGMLIQHVTYTA